MLEQYYNKETNTLTLPYYFNRELCDLPLDTKVIIFEEDSSKSQDSQFNQAVDKLPNSITHLTFGCHFNQPVDNLPNSITHLTFGYYFNQPVNNLPNSITHLTFKTLFNNPVNNLPNSIIHLTFEYYSKFDQPIDNLPNSITHLTFGYYFNQPVNNLPTMVKKITIPNNKTCLLKKIPFNCDINSWQGYLIKRVRGQFISS